MNKKRIVKFGQRGVVIIEAMIAILLFSLGVLAIVGLQVAMIKSVDDARYRTVAGYIAQKRISQMWTDPANVATYVETNTNISSLLPGGTRTVAQTASGQYQVTVTWLQPGPGSTQRNFTTMVVINGG